MAEVGPAHTALRLTENIPVGTYVLETTPEGVPSFTFVSDRWLRMLQVTREEVMADPSVGFRCVHPEDFEAFMALNLEVFARPRRFQWEGRIVVDGEVRWLNVESVPRPLDNGGWAFEGVMVDVTDYKNAEAALRSSHARLTAAEVERSRLEERQNLLQDMHDGFGSQLATARRMAASGHLDQDQLVGLLDECLMDLYLVADALGSDDPSLAESLADLRYRTRRRLSTDGELIEWALELEQLPPVPPRHRLQVLRVVQEALNNALRHAGARRIRVEARHDVAAGCVQVRVEDDGGGIPDGVRPGRGLMNMQARARHLGATLQVDSDASGTRVCLHYPLPAG